MSLRTSHRCIVAVDFDGTIAKTNYPTIISLQDNVVNNLTKLRELGCYLIIWTCRCGDPLIDAINFLLENQVPFDKVNDNHNALKVAFANNTRKVSADFYIDDKDWMQHPIYENSSSNFPNWDSISNIIEKSLQHNSFKSILSHAK